MSKAHVEVQAHTPAERGELLLKTLFTDNFALLEALYERRDSLPFQDIYIAAALGNVPLVESMLAADSTWATRVGGPLQTQAITYACFGRFALFDPAYSARQQTIVTSLLAHGANPNASAYEKDRGKEGNGRLSSLYGCCRAPGNPQVAKILLDAGASTDDGESLYHASELPDPTCLELLFAAGVPKRDQEYCIVRALDHEAPRTLAVYLKYGTNPNHLDWALFRMRSREIIAMLVEHGADLNAPCREHRLLGRIQGLTPVAIAERNGTPEIVEYLSSKGAVDTRTPKDRLIGACAREDESAVRALLREHPGLIRTLNANDHSNIAAFARAGRLHTVRLMLDAGFDIEARADDLDATALLYAASNGNVAMIDLLIAHGARLDVRHRYGGSPLGTALYCAAHFANREADYPNAVLHLIEAGEPVEDEHLQFALAADLDEIASVLRSHAAAV
jgi:ankyrin repeat protein